MNVLDTDKRAQILNCLVEGCSMRSTQRLCGVAKKTVERLLVSAGDACLNYLEDNMVNLNCKVLQIDEIWSFTYSKQRNVPARMIGTGAGDTWTWVAIDSESKLIPVFYCGDRNTRAAQEFIYDLKKRLANRVQITSDGFTPTLRVMLEAFGDDVDYGVLRKTYAVPLNAERRYSPPVCTGAQRVRVIGEPDQKLISTSHIECRNLHLRMTNRRFTRLTNGYSKKLENHIRMMAISMMHYNYCRIHSAHRITPAMAAGISDRVWSLEEVVGLIP